MKIKIKKRGADAVVTIVRDDGSATSGRLGSGGFGAVHDLTHYAVETTLGLRHGFYGLVAQGWDISGFEVKGMADKIPDEGIITECIVGQLTNAVFASAEQSPGEFNDLVRATVAGVRPNATAPVIGADTLRQMIQTLNTLLARWRELPSGEILELDFPAG